MQRIIDFVSPWQRGDAACSAHHIAWTTEVTISRIHNSAHTAAAAPLICCINNAQPAIAQRSVYMSPYSGEIDINFAVILGQRAH